MKWLLKPVYTVDGIVNVFLRSNITLLLLTVIILIHLLYFTIQENWFYVLLLIIMTFVSTYICSTGTLGLLLTLLTAYIVMIVHNDGFPVFFQDDEYLEGFKRRKRKGRKRRNKGIGKRKFKVPKAKIPKVGTIGGGSIGGGSIGGGSIVLNNVPNTVVLAEKANRWKERQKLAARRWAEKELMKKLGKKEEEERRKKEEERRKKEEERRKKEQAAREQVARDTAFRQQTRDALNKTNYEINRQQIEYQTQQEQKQSLINEELSENLPYAEYRSNQTSNL